MQNLIDIALVVLRIIKVVKPTTFPWNLRQNKSDVNGVKEKHDRVVHPINFCGWPSKIFQDLKFRGKHFLRLSENLQLSRSFLSWFLKIFLIYP